MEHACAHHERREEAAAAALDPVGEDRAKFERALRIVTPAHVTYGARFKDGKYLSEFVQQNYALWCLARST